MHAFACTHTQKSENMCLMCKERVLGMHAFGVYTKTRHEKDKGKKQITTNKLVCTQKKKSSKTKQQQQQQSVEEKNIGNKNKTPKMNNSSCTVKKKK